MAEQKKTPFRSIVVWKWLFLGISMRNITSSSARTQWVKWCRCLDCSICVLIDTKFIHQKNWTHDRYDRRLSISPETCILNRRIVIFIIIDIWKWNSYIFYSTDWSTLSHDRMRSKWITDCALCLCFSTMLLLVFIHSIFHFLFGVFISINT